MKFTCQMCGECCRRYTITVTGSDTHRIARFTGLNASKFLTVVRPHESVSETYFDTPKIRFGDEDNNVLALKEEDEACMFRKGTKCTIYGARPLICRPFPFNYSLRSGRGIEFTVNEEARSFCKGLGVGSTEFDFKELSGTVHLMEMERTSFRKEIKKWNAKVTNGRTAKPRIIDLIKFLVPSIKRDD
jgi:Fe-S-cluster containining protein